MQCRAVLAPHAAPTSLADLGEESEHAVAALLGDRAPPRQVAAVVLGFQRRPALTATHRTGHTPERQCGSTR